MNIGRRKGPRGSDSQLRVVADTNIYVSALQFGGLAEDLWLLAKANAFDLFISPPILEELARVLSEKFGWRPPLIDEAMAEVRGYAEMVLPQTTLTEIKDDPTDDCILECALEAAADVIVSGDRHLLQVKKFRGIEILTLRDFLQLKPWAAPAK